MIEDFRSERNADKQEIANSFSELKLRIRDVEKREEQASEKLSRVAKEWEVLERKSEKLSELAAQMQVDAMKRVKSASEEKFQVEKLRKELFQSKNHLNPSINEGKEDLPSVTVDSSGGNLTRPTTTFIENGAIGVIPSLQIKVNPELELEERLSVKLHEQRVLPSSKPLRSNSVTDTASVIYHELYSAQNDYIPAVLQENSKAKAPKRRTSHPSSAFVNDEFKASQITSTSLIRMIESGEHTITTFFFLGKEKKMVKTIKGVMKDISLKLKSLVENNEVVELPDITVEGFETMLKFVYSTGYSLSPENLVPTMACASKFDLDDLYRTCFDWLEINLSSSDTLRILDDCIKHAAALGTTAKKAVEKSAWDLMISDGEGIKDVLGKLFEARDASWVRNVVEGNSLVCSEDILFDAVAHWACHQTKVKYPNCKCLAFDMWKKTDDEKASEHTEAHSEVESRIAEIAPFVRFPEMPAKYLTQNKLISSILRPEEILEVLRYQHDPDISDTKFHVTPRYKTIEVSQGGCCAQSSEHFAILTPNTDTAHTEKSSMGVAGSQTVRILAAGLAVTKRLLHNHQIIEEQNDLNVAQTKYDYQPWWDMDLGRLCRIQKVQVYLGEPIRSLEQRRWSNEEDSTNDMFPLVLCLARDAFPNMEGTLAQSMQMSVKTKYFDRAPTNRRSILVEWEPALVAARTFRIQCERQTILRILHVRIFSAEPVDSGPMPQVVSGTMV